MVVLWATESVSRSPSPHSIAGNMLKNIPEILMIFLVQFIDFLEMWIANSPVASHADCELLVILSIPLVCVRPLSQYGSSIPFYFCHLHRTHRTCFYHYSIVARIFQMSPSGALFKANQQSICMWVCKMRMLFLDRFLWSTNVFGIHVIFSALWYVFLVFPRRVKSSSQDIKVIFLYNFLVEFSISSWK